MFGFNLLMEGLVSRDVSGFDEAGRPRLSAESTWQPSEGASGRLECRACWHTFPLPEGLQGPATTGEIALPPVAPAHPSTSLEAKVAGLTQVVEELRALGGASPSPPQASEEASRRSVLPAKVERDLLDKIEELREAIVRQAADTREREEALETANRQSAEARGWLAEVIARLEVEQKATRQRLDGQADVIRGLHAAAQEQKARQQQVQAAMQRLEELVAALGRAGQLPTDL
jgi:hypothetical protein